MKKWRKKSNKLIGSNHRTAELKLQAIIDSASMTNQERIAYYLKHNLDHDIIARWKKIILAGLDQVAKQTPPHEESLIQRTKHTIVETKISDDASQQEKNRLFNFSWQNTETSNDKITLHTGAVNYLFEHFYTLRRIFSNVIGQMETDYFVIAMINKKRQIFFLSSNPSIEQNMIEKNLWHYDGSFSSDFVYQNKPALWTKLYHPKYESLIFSHKQNILKLINGISIPINYFEYRAVLCFGFKTEHSLFAQQSTNQLKKLSAMGQFCLHEITKSIPMLDKCKSIPNKTTLRLIY